MKISLMDRSLYYKGLMLLIRQDREIHHGERKRILNIGNRLGFNEKFCAERIAEILDNPYLVDEPPVFEAKEVALCFLKDGLVLAASDGQVHEAEVAWLTSVALQNRLGREWREDIAENPRIARDLPEHALELNKFEWD